MLYHFDTAFLNANPENTVDIAWTPGHKGIIGNELTGKLTKQATEIPGGPTKVTHAHALRRANEKAFEKWTAKWKRTDWSFRKRGPFTPADSRTQAVY
ncbi:hypothetical protein SCP_1603400 [Sparassis crispa]|uniref:RNase H type-1 domain-containing protein n=1 Tax=Sparassis crispa TaxID=139825 RepID=A0A401H5F7_9APHY|nr:hypothetical protein SCP_1603400 [Sparassis crispa]GBE89676.1 hypothetical protein SCP_1603400 [Sparassis crispa]